MDRVAIIVDAGYLFAQGSVSMTGHKQPRNLLILNIESAIALLKKFAAEITSNLPLLRIYWYDGASGTRRLSDEHSRLAHQNDLKLRLGFLNTAGEQKGVDSLIVTDMVELARNRAASDLVLLSGDEDIRIGAQIAQSFGVRVHLLGIASARGSQSHQLMQEADTCTEWDSIVIKKLLRLPDQTTRQSEESADLQLERKLDEIADELVNSLNHQNAVRILDHVQTHKNLLPAEHDAKLLAQSRATLGRELTSTERRYLRSRFRELIRTKS